MGRVATDLRETRESARMIRFEATASIPQTNVQTAIEQVQTNVAAIAGASPGYTPTVVTFAMSPYTPLIADTVLLVTTAGGAVVINMPLASARLTSKGYQPLIIKDDVGNASTASITINRAGAELIDGLAAYVIDSNYTSVNLQPKAAGGYDVV